MKAFFCIFAVNCFYLCGLLVILPAKTSLLTKRALMCQNTSKLPEYFKAFADNYEILLC